MTNTPINDRCKGILITLSIVICFAWMAHAQAQSRSSSPINQGALIPSTLFLLLDDDAPTTDTRFRLSVAVSGNGHVGSQPGGIDCGADCQQDYLQGTSVTLTATAQPGFEFQNWSGACSGHGSCNVVLADDLQVFATFKEIVIPPDTILIENYTAKGPAFQLADIPNNASGITWHPLIEQYLVVRNNSAIIYRYNSDFTYLGQVSIGGINNKDTEGLSYVGGNKVMVAVENNYLHKIEIDASSTNVSAHPSVAQAYRLLPTPNSNKGLEGVAVRKAGEQLARVYACQEGAAGAATPAGQMRVVYFDMPATDPLTLLTYESNLTVVEPFAAEQAFSGELRDLAGMVYDERTGHLIILSQVSDTALQVNPDTGAIISQLSLSGAPQYEGVTIGQNGELVFVSEGNYIRVYHQSPP